MKSADVLRAEQNRMKRRQNEQAMTREALRRCQEYRGARPMPYDPTRINQEREAGIVSDPERKSQQTRGTA